MISTRFFEFSQTCFKTAGQWFRYFFWALLLAIPLAVTGWFIGLVMAPALSDFNLFSRGAVRRSANFGDRILAAIVLTFGAPVVVLASIAVLPVVTIGGVASFALGGVIRLFEKIFRRQRNYRTDRVAERDRPAYFMRDEPLLEQRRAVLPAARVAAEVGVWYENHLGRRQNALRSEAPAMQAPIIPQARRWEEIDQDVLIRQNISRLLDDYHRVENVFWRARILESLRSAYGQYREIFPGPAHENSAVESILNNARPAQPENVSSPASDEQQRLNGFRQLFRLEDEPRSLYDLSAVVMQGQRRRTTHLLRQPFTNAEITRLQANLIVLPSDSDQIKKVKERNKILFDAVCDDEIVMTSMHAPIRLPDGRTYDLLTATKMIDRFTQIGQTPDRQSSYRLEDIIPNNTLSRAMQYLLTDLTDEAKPISFNEEKKQEIERQIRALKADASYRATPPRIADEKLAEFELFYQNLESPRHKDLFSILCRDPLTGKIIQDPVYLPDGYTYNRETVLALLHDAQTKHQSAFCPMASQVPFRDEDIKICYNTRNLLQVIEDQIKLISDAQVARGNEEQKNEEQKGEGVVSSLAASASASIVPLRPSTPTSQEQGAKLQVLYAQYSANDSPQRSLVRPPLSQLEIEQISKHLADKDGPVKRLFNAACLDERSLIRTPMRLRKHQSGDTCNLDTALRYCPADQQHLLLMPNNTLAVAYQHLIDAINNQPIIKRQYQVNIRLGQRPSSMFFQPADVTNLEDYYKALSRLQQQLFDDMCRDPITGEIFQDPVYLPDGKTYNRSTATLLLEFSEGSEVAYIPETDITFTKADIIVCNHTKKIMKTLRDIVAQQRIMVPEVQSRRVQPA